MLITTGAHRHLLDVLDGTSDIDGIATQFPRIQIAVGIECGCQMVIHGDLAKKIGLERGGDLILGNGINNTSAIPHSEGGIGDGCGDSTIEIKRCVDTRRSATSIDGVIQHHRIGLVRGRHGDVRDDGGGDHWDGQAIAITGALIPGGIDYHKLDLVCPRAKRCCVER